MSDTPPGAEAPVDQPHWRGNLFVCMAGSFSTVVAMTLLLPFLPLYVQELGVRDHAAVVQWSGIAFGITFLSSGLCAPLWGYLADRYGRKSMLIRASLGMAVAMSLIGMAHNVWQLVALRLLAGLLGGYASGSMALVAAQTPRARTGWALGMLSSAIMAGNVAGPLIGGALPPLIGIRDTFWAAGGVIFLAFVATLTLLREQRRPAAGRVNAANAGSNAKVKTGWSAVPRKRPIVVMLVTSALLAFALMSIEPIITVYVAQLVANPDRVTWTAGLVMSATALGSVLSSARLGRLADRVGHWLVVTVCLALAALLLAPQAFVTASWQLVLLRFLMGLALGGLMPCITAVIRHRVPERSTGAILGYAVSAQYVGQVLGPLLGGFIGGHLGMRPVFFATAALLAVGAAWNWRELASRHA